MYKIVFSEAAELDLEDIFDYSYFYFGQNKGAEYEMEINKNIEKILKNPEIGHSRKDIPKNSLAWAVGNHFLIYRIENDYIHLLRILHEKLDFLNQFN